MQPYMNFRTFIGGVQLALRASIAAAISFAIAQFMGLQHPIYALIGAVIVTDMNPAQSRALGLRRIVATIIGAICGAVLSAVIPPDAWAIGIGIFVAMLICHLLRATDAAKIAGYICAIVVLTHSGDPWLYALYRFIETVLGVLVAWGISYVPKLIPPDEPKQAA